MGPNTASLTLRCPPPHHPPWSPVLQAAQALAARHPGLLVETKRVSVALHYRLAPHLESLCHDTLVHAMREVDGVELLRGKCVFEVKPRGVHKGQAIIDFMTQPPFAGRTPVFVGDDVTDEAGFAAVQCTRRLGHQGGRRAHHGTTPLHDIGRTAGWLSSARTTLERER